MALRHDQNAITELSAAVARIGAYQWPRKITDPQRAFMEAVAEAFEVDLDPDQVEETLAHLGSIARMVAATMSNTANPTMLSAGYKHNVIPGVPMAGVDGRFLPGSEDEFYATIADLIGDKVRYEVVTHHPSVETSSRAPWLRLCRPAWRRRIRCPGCALSVQRGYRWQGLAQRWHPCFGFAPLRLPPRPGLPGHVPRRRRASTHRLAGVRRPRSGPLP